MNGLIKNKYLLYKS